MLVVSVVMVVTLSFGNAIPSAEVNLQMRLLPFVLVMVLKILSSLLGALARLRMIQVPL